MKKLIMLVFILFVYSQSNAENLVKSYSIKDTVLKGSFEAFLMDSVKEVGDGRYEINTIENLPPLEFPEGELRKNIYRSEKM